MMKKQSQNIFEETEAMASGLPAGASSLFKSPVKISTIKQRNAQRGASLFIVLVMLILGLVSVLGALRVGLINESFVGSDVDAQRSFAAAEATMRDAQLDIAGLKPDGTPCSTNANAIGCRVQNAGVPTEPFVIQQGNLYKLNYVFSTIPAGKECHKGICVSPAGLITPFWTTQAALDAKKPEGAKYGEYTGASPSDNPILATKSWYWIEQYPYDQTFQGANRNMPIPSQNFSYIFRITVLSEGNKPGTKTILQTYFSPWPNRTGNVT